MNVGAAGAFAAVLLGAAILLWPRRASSPMDVPVVSAADAGRIRSALRFAAEGDGRGRHEPRLSPWQQDPVDLYRRWRLQRRPGDLVDDVLDLLRGIGPALGAGLTPSRAIELAATSTLGADRVRLARHVPRRTSRRLPDLGVRVGVVVGVGPGLGLGGRAGARLGAPADIGAPPTDLGAPRGDIDRLVGALLQASDRAEPSSPVWAEWARRSASPELALVAAAWSLSETTGAPLASAVERAVRGLLDARARSGKVAVAVAGPRATITVLTLLPLTGPLFGLACGIDPAALYLGSPLATVSVTFGLLLVWLGRVWCSTMVRRAVQP